MLNKIVQFVVLACLILIYSFDYYPVKIDSGFLSFILLLILISTTSFFVLRKENLKDLKKQYLKFTILFTIAFFIVHFQAYIDYILGNIDQFSNFIWINLDSVNKSILLSSTAIVSYFLGYSFKSSLKASAIKQNISTLKLLDTKVLSNFALLFLMLFFLLIDKRYFSGGYGDVELGVAIYFSLLFESSINALFIVNSRNLYIRNQEINRVTLKYFLNYNKKPLLLLFLYLAGVMLSGDRGPIIYNTLFVAISYVYSSRLKIKLQYLIFFVILGASVVTLLGVVRRLDDNTSFIDRTSKNLSLDNEVSHYPNSFLTVTRELAFSSRCLHIAVNAKDSGFEGTFGLFAVQDIMLLIPTLKGTFINVSNIPVYLTSSAQFLTFSDRGAFSSWGTGTSCVADTYLDFGFIGVIIVFLILGFFIRKMEMNIFVSNYIPPFYIIIILFCFFSYSIYIPRSTLLYSVNKFMYIYVMILICQFINKKKFS